MTVITNVKGITPSDSQDLMIIKLLNKFIVANLPAINSNMPDDIKDNNLDPIEGEVYSNNKDLPDPILGDHKVTYHVSDLKGLSSLSISRFEIMSIDKISAVKRTDNPKDCAVSLRIQIDAEVQRNLDLGYAIQANVRVDVANAPKGLQPFSGIVTASKVTAKSEVFLNAGIEDAKLCVRELSKIEFQNLEFTDCKFEIDKWNSTFSLDPFKKCPFTAEAKTEIESAVKKQVNERLHLCVGLDDLRKIIPTRK